MTNKPLNLSLNFSNNKAKSKFFLDSVNRLTLHHFKNCKIYKKIIKNLNFKLTNKNKIEDFPMIPARMFKKFDLYSVSKNKIIKTLVSSGTSGQKLSKIYLDKINAENQIRVLKGILETILGKKRLPMLIIDKNPKVLDRGTFNARLAAIYGFSFFGKNHCYLLKQNSDIDYKSLNLFLKKYSNNNFFIFGFTSLIFENLTKKLSTRFIFNKFHNGILLHGGGWKKMEKIGISNDLFKKKLLKKLNLKNIYNYYGLVEQTGSIFLECNKCGYLVTSNYSEILIRSKNFRLLEKGEKGLIQLISLLPTSYPGHNILTEDIGEIVDNGKCICELNGKRFLVYGRAKEAELRGCSDAR